MLKVLAWKRYMISILLSNIKSLSIGSIIDTSLPYSINEICIQPWINQWIKYPNDFHRNNCTCKTVVLYLKEIMDSIGMKDIQNISIELFSLMKIILRGCCSIFAHKFICYCWSNKQNVIGKRCNGKILEGNVRKPDLLTLPLSIHPLLSNYKLLLTLNQKS